FGRFIAVGEAGTIVYSADGVTWTASTINSTNSLSNTNLTAMAFSGSTLMAVGQGGTVLTSGDGLTWTAQTTNITQNLNAVAISPGTTTTLPAVVTTSSFWVAVGDAGAVYTSVDGITWTAQNTGLESVTTAWRGVSVLVNTSSTLDCGVGSPAVTSISISYSIALVGDGGNVATAGPALAWTLSTLDGAPRLNKVISPAGQFVAVGNAGAVYTGNLNADASSVTWSGPRASGTTSNLNGLLRYGKDAALAYSNSYIAYGQGGVALYSR
ncbi:MAG: WD40/YVTN/BNR-like repeat-containing protein, partial [Limnohabitans sp.]